MTLALGYRSVDEMLETLSTEEYYRWIAYFSEEGYPQENTEFWNAQLVSTIMNSSGRYRKTFAPKDFMFRKWQADPSQATLQEQAEADKAFGAKLLGLQSRK